MAKKGEPKRAYKTGDLARFCGVTTVTITNWEKNGSLPKAHRTDGDQRFWTAAEVKRFLTKKGFAIPAELRD